LEEKLTKQIHHFRFLIHFREFRPEFSFIRGAHGCLLIYDITNRKTFDGVCERIRIIRRDGTKDMVVVLVGNKCDLEDKRQVSFDEAHKLAEKHSN
jgi:GTPase SAR1 family protein